MTMATQSRKTVLVVGSGGREHALAWKLAQSPQVGRVIVAPGNPGMPAEWERWALPPAAQFPRLARQALDAGVDLAVIGSEVQLADGIADVFEQEGLRTFGPSAAAARLESSKAFAKEIMEAARVPTARHFVVKSGEEARKLLMSLPWGQGWVIKADGLAMGKGVVVCATREEALAAAESLIRVSGSLVIEERLIGEELSWMAFCDGEHCSLLEPARDYKRVFDGNRGPNTGGMGAFSPVPGIPEEFWERVREEVFLPTLREMKLRSTPFRGLLYAGLMADVAAGKFWVIEFNARFGDPETQVLMPRIAGDLYAWMESVARGDLREHPARVPFVREAAVYVVGAAGGYPDSPEKGKPIAGPLRETGYFSAGVASQGDGLVTSGGRVFGALGMGATHAQARSEAYRRMGQVSFPGMHYRRDIAGEIT